ncbi:MAG: HAD family hydrolase, partial [bacterium]|nr:HAD family hydrolase [bacterium]
MANGQHHRIEAVAFDAMFTIFQPRTTRPELNARVLYDVARIRVDPEEFDAILARLRSEHPRLRGEDMDAYWTHLNAETLTVLRPRKFTPRDARKIGHAMHRKTLSDASLYEVRPEMRELLAQTRERVPLAIASNQRHRALLAHVRAAGIEGLFGPHLYASGRIGSPKPSRHFWHVVRAGLGCHSFAAIAYVGNSVQNDVELAHQYGAPVALLDRTRAIPGLAFSGVTVVHDERELGEWIHRMT